MINAEIVKKIKSFNYNVNDIVTYLLSLHYNTQPSYIPELVMKEANYTGIYNRDFKRGIIWNIPLLSSEPFPNQQPSKVKKILDDSKFEWVIKEYRPLFMNLDPTRGGDRKSCIKKMKKFMLENPKVTKEDIINGTKLYLSEFLTGQQNVNFLIHADYFISKFNQSRLSQYVELYLENPVTKVESTQMKNVL